jgi:hypothetical protein
MNEIEKDRKGKDDDNKTIKNGRINHLFLFLFWDLTF